MFVREGARVVGCDVQDGAAERTAAVLADQGFDVTGGIDVLYNSAAGAGFAPFDDLTLDLWRHVLHVELDIVFHITKPAWRHLLPRATRRSSTPPRFRGCGASRRSGRSRTQRPKAA